MTIERNSRRQSCVFKRKLRGTMSKKTNVRGGWVSWRNNRLDETLDALTFLRGPQSS